MTESTTNQVKVAELQPKPSRDDQSTQTDQNDSTSQTDSSVNPEMVTVEVSQVREQVHQALEAQRSGFNNLTDEYRKEAVQLRNDAVYELYDMISGHSLYRSIGAGVGQLMGAHPTEAKVALSLGKTELKTVSLPPFTPAITQNLSTRALKSGESK